MFFTNSAASSPHLALASYATVQIGKEKKKRKESNRGCTCRPNKSQLVRATRCLLRIIFLRKDVALQIGQVDDSRAIAGQPCGRENLMSDKGRPDWLPVTGN